MREAFQIVSHNKSLDWLLLNERKINILVVDVEPHFGGRAELIFSDDTDRPHFDLAHEGDDQQYLPIAVRSDKLVLLESLFMIAEEALT